MSQPVHAPSHIDLNRGCDRSCDFCAVKATEKTTSAQRGAAAVAAVQRAIAGQVRSLTLTGGEPTLEPWLPQLLQLAQRGGIPERVLETHAGTMTPARARQLADAGLTRAIVAVNCLDPEVSDRLTGTDNDLRRTLLGLRALLAAGIDVDVTAALLPETAPLLADLRAGLPRLAQGLPGRLLRLVVRVIVQSPRSRPLVALADAAAALTAALVADSALPLAQASGQELPACAFADPVQALPLLVLSQQFAQREAQRHQRLPQCADCSLQAVCPGVRPALVAAMTGQHHPVPAHLAALVGAVDAVVAADTRVPQSLAEVQARWPALCQGMGLPSSTALPAAVAHALLERRIPPAPVWRLEDREFDREALELQAGLRQLLRREVPDPERVRLAVQSLEQRGFCVAVLTSAVAGVAGRPRHHVFASRDPEILAAARVLDTDLGGEPLQKAKAIRQFGLWFGYPPCCVEAFLRGAALDDALLVADRAARQPDHALPWVQNWALVPLRLGSWLPCAPDCAASLLQTRAVAALLKDQAPGWLASARPLLQAPILALGFDRVVMLPGATRERVADGHSLWHYRQVVDLTQLAGHVAPVPRLSWLAFTWTVTAALRQGNRLQSSGKQLQVWQDDDLVHVLQFVHHAPPVLDFSAPSGTAAHS
jgi:hypothetical protein